MAMASEQLLSVYWTDRDGNQYCEMKLESDLDLVRSAWERLTMGPAAQMGVIKQVLLVDSMDCTVLIANPPC